LQTQLGGAITMKKQGQRWVNTIERTDSVADWVPFVSEIPSGSRAKYALDKVSGHLTLHRILPEGIAYPTNYGFIPRTLSKEDGGELDLMAISTEPLLPLTILRVRLIGGCSIRAGDQPSEDKLLGAVVCDPGCTELTDLHAVDDKLKARIAEFFTTYKLNEAETVAFEGWYDRLAAIDKVKASIRARVAAKKKRKS
jgi:inorganic pyrophosphatase